jgi:homoserine kinase
VSEIPGPIRLVLPATSANLGSAFDSAGLAMALTLTVEASVANAGPELEIAATGRDAERVARTRHNLIFETYRELLASAGREVLPLRLRIHNEIPLGMGCGSSAAALLAGALLASHFGRLGWDLHACMEEACRREGHPDNVAACALGYMTVSANTDSSVVAVTCGHALKWKLLLALPSSSLATERARALLPAAYSRADAVHNIQRAALLVGAFAEGRSDLLRAAMEDRIHQPYRSQVCPLLPVLLPLAGSGGVLGVALSGAGPGVLLILDSEASVGEVTARIQEAAADPNLEVLETRIAGGVSIETAHIADVT